MKTAFDSIACAVIRQPSISRWGVRAMISRSLNAPGSDSSALTTTYFGFGLFWSISEALRPIGKPAPPRPRKVASLISWTTAAGVIARARASDSYPPTARYSSSCVRSRSPAPARRSSGCAATSHLLHDCLNVLGLDEVAVALVDCDDGRISAAAETFDRPEGDLPVCGRPSRHDAELLGERVDDSLRPRQRARQVRADLDHVLPHGSKVEHVVEGRDRFADRRRRSQRRGTFP